MCRGHYWSPQVMFVIPQKMIICSGSRRSLVTTLRAAEKFEKAHLSSPEVARLIDGAKVFYVEGYFLTHGIESAVEVAKKASDAGKVHTQPPYRSTISQSLLIIRRSSPSTYLPPSSPNSSKFSSSKSSPTATSSLETRARLLHGQAPPDSPTRRTSPRSPSHSRRCPNPTPPAPVPSSSPKALLPPSSSPRPHPMNQRSSP